MGFYLLRKKQRFFFWIIILITLLGGVAATLWPLPASNHPLITEVMASNGNILTDEDGDTPDWLELFNPHPYPINLAAFALSDDPDQPQKWPLPNHTLPAGHYLVIFASGKNRAAPYLHTNFKLNKAGSFLGLYSILDQRFVDSLPPTPYLRNVSLARLNDGVTPVYLGNPTPGQPNDTTRVWRGLAQPVQFSMSRGLFEAPFSLQLGSDSPGAIIRYTLDGSLPTEANGQLYTGPLQITGTSLVRAAAFIPNHLPSEVVTHSYLFVEQVLAQPPNPPGFPNTWGTHQEEFKQFKPGAPVTADYEMDPQVVNDPRYQTGLREGLTSLPTLSIVMDLQDFADLYAHPRDRGREWERPASVELIDPTGRAQGFQVNAGIRMHGGVGRKEFLPKHSFRLVFRGEYGPTQLRYPLFPDSPVEAFNMLVLRSGSDRSFAGLGPIREKTTYTRDQWMRESQLAMSGVGSRGIFVHLYLNGLYWGLYNVVERPDEAFMAAYLGGAETDWFVANQDGPLSRESNEWRDALNELFVSIAVQGRADNLFERPADDVARQVAAIKPYLDTAQFCDYIILNWYAGTEDWPQNNWYAAISHPNGNGKFLVWDAQETFADGAQITLGEIDSARLNLIKPLFELLIQDADFQMEFADRLYLHLANNGALADANAKARWLKINGAIEQAIIAESARWGDVWFDRPITQADWFKARDEVLRQMDGNAARLIELTRQAGYYPAVDPPLFNQAGGVVEPGFELTMQATQPQGGAIYYTTNGNDPRMAGTGQVSASAHLYRGPVIITDTTRIKARLFSNRQWSALNQANFSVAVANQKLRITEIMYNPRGGNEYEFIELKNVGETEVDLSNSWFEGIDFTFPAVTTPLPPGEFLVLANDPVAFAERYPDVKIGGVYRQRLSNAGETITIKDSQGRPIVSVSYSDTNGWPISPDGRGDSLVLVNPNGDPNDPKNWRASANLHGSPGADDPQQQPVQQFLP